MCKKRILNSPLKIIPTPVRIKLSRPETAILAIKKLSKSQIKIAIPAMNQLSISRIKIAIPAIN